MIVLLLLMLYFILAYLWSWVIVPFTFIILRPFIRLKYIDNVNHFICTVLGIKQKITGYKIIEEGFILSNHRSFIDCFIDTYSVKNSTIIARYLVILVAPFVVLFAHLENRVILINRGKDKRNVIYEGCVLHINRYKNKIIIFYPEGTRNKYTTLSSQEELKSYIKFEV